MHFTILIHGKKNKGLTVYEPEDFAPDILNNANFLIKQINNIPQCLIQVNKTKIKYVLVLSIVNLFLISISEILLFDKPQ